MTEVIKYSRFFVCLLFSPVSLSFLLVHNFFLSHFLFPAFSSTETFLCLNYNPFIRYYTFIFNFFLFTKSLWETLKRASLFNYMISLFRFLNNTDHICSSGHGQTPQRKLNSCLCFLTDGSLFRLRLF